MPNIAVVLQLLVALMGATGTVELIKWWVRRRTKAQDRVDVAARVQEMALDFVRDIKSDADEARAATREAQAEAEQLRRALRLARREVAAMADRLTRLHYAINAPNATVQELREIAKQDAAGNGHH